MDYAEAECCICLQTNLALKKERDGNLLNGFRCSSCGITSCKACNEEMKEIARKNGKRDSCPVCRIEVAENNKENFNRILENVKKGKGWAFEIISGLYYQGLGVPRSEELGTKYCTMAADLGYPAACHNLATRFHQKNEMEKAKYYYKKAAAGSYPGSIYNLGIIAMQEGDLNTCFTNVKLASEKGHAQALLNLASLYEDGKGTPKSSTLAIYYYKLFIKENKTHEGVQLAKFRLTNLLTLNEKSCASCGKSGVALVWCSKCVSLKYCNKECQTKHWFSHKTECKKFSS